MNARLQTTEAATFDLHAERTLGQIAVELPGATAVFRRLKLDFCCGGQVSLALAAGAKGLDVVALLAELGALQRTDQPIHEVGLNIHNIRIDPQHDIAMGHQ